MKTLLHIGLMLSTLALLPLIVVAAPVEVSDRATLAGNDSFDWANVGPESFQPTNPFSLLSGGGAVTLTASTTSDNNLRLLNDTSLGFPSGFGRILEVGLTDNSGPLSISFDTPVFGVGAEINAAASCPPFQAKLTLFDDSDAILGTFLTGSVACLSEPFLGATDSSGISRIEFDIVEMNNVSQSYRFAISTLDIVVDDDDDDDGVGNNDDFCPDTSIPEGVPTKKLNPNHWALTDNDLEFDTVIKGKGKGPGLSYTTADTAGCSCEQIIAALELGNGHMKHGCSISAMDDWFEVVNP